MNANTLTKVLYHSNWRDIASLCTTCTYIAAYYHTLRTRRQKFGEMYLYERQEEAIAYLRTQLSASNSVKFKAFVSFGKSLVGLYLAREYATRTQCSAIVMPKTIFESWKMIIAQAFPREIHTRINNRRILFMSNAIIQYIHKAQEQNRPDAILNRIYVTWNLEVLSACLAELNITPALIVFDEMHRNYKHNNPQPTTKILRMGATENKKTDPDDDPIQSLSLTSEDVIRPYICMNIMTEVTSIVDSINAATGKYIICILPRKNNISRNYNTHIAHTYICDQFKRSQWCKFVETGGLFIVNLQSVIEGYSLNYCDTLIIQLQNYSSNISLDRLQQLAGRVRRQSSVRAAITVNCYVENTTMAARCALMDIECSGYDASVYEFERLNRTRSLEQILEMPKLDRILLFGTPIDDEFIYSDSRETNLAIADIITVRT